ncbi:hypothetical protein BOTBODRAFT_144923 [Botryobasidium botryosum FD-172 SS1]|uniref:Uncharacterized protein n=1 Tax=Botryobasidium botryosum (strain FD-172 SS1) TaxID=930990 RepID=A0A067MWK1_BOTB1|nr:hypothetical protein BOTBODRAFT_144923 [Botryobasidium botryosum FD-172 SS1]
MSASRTLKQLQYVFAGGAVTYYVGIPGQLARISQMSGWASVLAQIALTSGGLTLILFLYLVLVLPRLRGVKPNYADWRHSSELASIIPLLTGSIFVGWTALVFVLAFWSDLGGFKSLIGAMGVYATVFGLLGLIPS